MNRSNRVLPTLLFSLLTLALLSCGGGGGDGNASPVSAGDVLVAPQDYEFQPAHSVAVQAYRQDSDGDSVADINDPHPADDTLATLSVFAEMEFNNNIAEANAVANTGYPFVVAAALARGATYYLDVDYFQFNAIQGDRISILLLDASVNADGNAYTFTRQPFSPQVSLINDSGTVVTTLAIGDFSAGMVGIGAEIPADGTYYIEVSDASVTATSYDYRYVLRVQADGDLDGVADVLETLLGSDANAADSDADGISDLHEILPLIVINPGATDQGQTNWWDVDDDGVVNWLDVDSDGDGPPDRLEGRMDVDTDSVANFLDTDANNNGRDDGEEVGESFQYPVDTDNDGLDDYMDFDADNDGIPASLDSDDTTARPPDYMFDDNALSILSVRTAIDDTTTLMNTVVPGRNLWVDGLNFDANTQVLFPVPGGSIAVTADSIESDNNQLKILVPDQAISGTLYVYNTVSLSNGFDIIVGDSQQDPVIYPLQDRTQAGATLVLNGANLSDNQVNVIFSSDQGSVSATGQASGDSVAVTVPANAVSGRVSVEAGGKTSNSVPVAIIDSIDAVIELPAGSLVSCDAARLTQFGVEKFADGACNLNDIDIDNNGIDFVSIFYTAGVDDIHLLLESVVLPGDTSITFNSLSTAVKLVFFNLGYQVSQPRTEWSGIRDTLLANADVQALADRIDELLQSDVLGYSQFTDATLVARYQQALISGSGEIATLLAARAATRIAGRADATFTPSAAQHDVLLSTVDPADINLENETRVYLSVQITDTSGKPVGTTDAKGIFHPYAHVRHPWDKNIIGPQWGGLFLISTGKDYKVSGRDSHFNIATGGIASPRDFGASAYQYTFGRTMFDGVAAPIINKILEKIIGQKLQSEDAAKIIIEVAGATAWNNFLSDAINGPDQFLSAFNLYVATPVKVAIESCFQLPVGPTCETLTLALAKHYGWTEYRIKTLIFKTVGKEIAAYLIPGVNVAKATYQMIDSINLVGSLLITGNDIRQTPGTIDFDVDFPLEISEAKPMCLIRGENETLLVKGKGFLPYTDGSLWWKKEVYPVAKLGIESGEVKTVNFDGTSMLADFSSVMPFLDNGDYSLSVEHQGQSAVYASPIQVATDGIVLDAITPNRSGRGSTVQLSGCGFSDSPSQNSVWFSAESSGGNIEHARATVLSASADSLLVVVPDDAITGDVYVEANNLSSNSLAFTVESSNVVITYGDNGAANDDTFSLYVDNFLVSTMPAPSRPFPVEVEMNAGVHTVKLVGITAPDDVGTYSIGFSTNVTVLSGPAQSGGDLTAGVVKSWQVEVTASTASRRPSSRPSSIILQPE